MTEHHEPKGEIRSEEDTTNIRRIGAKDRKKQIRMTGALFPDEPVTGAAEAIAPPVTAEQSQPLPDAGVAARPDTASKRPATAAKRPATKPRTASKRPSTKPKRRSSNTLFYNFIALMFVLATVAALVYFVFLWNNYNSPLNPFAPPTPMPNFIIVTPSS